jgi:hypothetical protein
LEKEGKKLVAKLRNDLVGVVWGATLALAEERSRMLAPANGESAEGVDGAATRAPAAKKLKREPTEEEWGFVKNMGSCTVMALVRPPMNEHAAHMHLLCVAYAAAKVLGWDGERAGKTSAEGATTLNEVAPRVDSRNAQEVARGQAQSNAYAQNVLSPRVSGDLAAFVLIVIQEKTTHSGRMDLDNAELLSRYFVVKKKMQDSLMWIFCVPSVTFHGDYADYADTLAGVAKLDFEGSLVGEGDHEAKCREKIPDVSTLAGLSRALYDQGSMGAVSKNWWWRLDVAVAV